MPSIVKFASNPELGEGFTIEKVDPEFSNQFHLKLKAAAIRHVVMKSWTEKFVPEYLSMEEVHAKMPSAHEQFLNITVPNPKQPSYWVSYINLPSLVGPPRVFNAALRMETYKPRLTSRLAFGKKPYPNISDLETQNGKLHGKYGYQAAALLYFALGESGTKRKVAAYSEEPNQDGVNFYENLGFEQKRLIPEVIGEHEMVYVHLEAPSVAGVREQLQGQYPFLAPYQ